MGGCDGDRGDSTIYHTHISKQDACNDTDPTHSVDDAEEAEGTEPIRLIGLLKTDSGGLKSDPIICDKTLPIGTLREHCGETQWQPGRFQITPLSKITHRS